jgi:NIPSNAP
VAKQREDTDLAEHYDIATVTVRPGTHPQALAVLEKTLADDPRLLACWYSEIGALNRILVIRKSADAAATIENRLATLSARSPLGIGELVAELSLDTYVSFDFMPPLQPGVVGPCFEVRSYGLKSDGLAPTIELWRKAVPARARMSPVLAAMVAVTGTAIRFLHIWPYKSVDERARLRAKAVADGVWPPPGGPGYLISQQADIYLPAAFSPIQ